ncbi:MAG: 50S ribosomal protein L22 [Candidatus Liptonbacteria bacterium]|nr:50S ribosomal protein L22 [Candidatus Liptonbacteria bacterium]
MVARASARYLRVAPRKARAVVHLVRGLSVNEAEALLVTDPHRAAGPILKLLRSAVANAVSGSHPAKPELLQIAEIYVDQGPMLKRSLPRARGSASPIQKKMSHVTLTLMERPDQKPARFTMIVAKKEKTAGKKKTKRESAHGLEGAKSEAGKSKTGGSWRKFFQRKTGER